MKSRLLGAVCACAIGLVSVSANAALIGRLEATLGAGDYQAYYDDVADLTWLADANVAGQVKWNAATIWVNSLSINGVTGWRLPTTPQDTCGSTSGLYYFCTDSEMGNLFYNVLGGVGGSAIGTTHNANYDLFSNIQSAEYWSSNYGSTNGSSKAWIFYFADGGQGVYLKGHNIYAWAVHDGDVGAVPIPPALYLFGSGLIGLVGMAKRKAA